MYKPLVAAGLGFILSSPAIADQLWGVIDQVDHDEGSIVISGESFYVTEGTRGPGLEELKVGDNVVVIYLPVTVQGTYDALYIKRQAKQGR
jgi:hypothetical protein